MEVPRPPGCTREGKPEERREQAAGALAQECATLPSCQTMSCRTGDAGLGSTQGLGFGKL